MVSILVPDLGDGIESVEVASWLKQPGERVEADEDLVEIVTDKASFFIPAPVGGILKSVTVAVGESARVGQSLGEID